MPTSRVRQPPMDYTRILHSSALPCQTVFEASLLNTSKVKTITIDT